ncbi:WD40 repeat-like protein [Linnemannia elongata AG-77]|uniref:WD40 repeat-like protein n=1 Tax=Linnemannia elongata AG-77 TaxID=1314771 RepID=A0A197K3T4_9FUNG|nr:WD40 repeat-like protein [Linnemannia elongata AG-77]
MDNSRQERSLDNSSSFRAGQKATNISLSTTQPKTAHIISPQELQDAITKAMSWKPIFINNIAAPSIAVALPQSDSHFETTTQLAYVNNLIRTHLSTASIDVNRNVGACLDPPQQALVDAILQDEDRQDHIRWLMAMIVEEFAARSVRTSAMLSEVILLGPSLNQEYHRKLLNILIIELETTTSLEVDILQAISQLVQCAEPDYLLPGDLGSILALLCKHLQEPHQQSNISTYYMLLALSHVLDAMVEGKVQDPSHIVHYEPLTVVLDLLMGSPDPNLKYQAAYALQCLLSIPHDEAHRKFALRHTGNIAMALLGVTSVCKLGFSGFSDVFRNATPSTFEVGSQAADEARSILESDDMLAIVYGGILSGRRQLWYPALREAEEHVRNGRLADFNHVVSEALCCQDFEFRWGVSRLLGEMAVDPLWDVDTREKAIDFLVEIYREVTIHDLAENVDNCIVDILQQVADLPDITISSRAKMHLQSLEHRGLAGEEGLYRDVQASPFNFYPLLARKPAPTSSPLLAQAQRFYGIDYDLHKLRAQRLEERDKILYIPPRGKFASDSSDQESFPLMEKALEFLASSRQVMLLLGDSGAGKSTFNLELENTLWKDYRKGDPIPLHIHLPAIDTPAQDLIVKQLRYYDFSESQIQYLKKHRQFILICDGYDESRLTGNLHTTNHLNKPRQWKAKVVISCRSQYLGLDYRARFEPAGNRYGYEAPADLFQEVFIASFSRAQIKLYVECFVERTLSDPAFLPGQTPWVVDDYTNKLDAIPNLIDLVSNPFLLTMALRALPKVVKSEQALSDIRLTRIELYDIFTKDWLDTNKKRFESSPLSEQARTTFSLLCETGFYKEGLKYQKDLSEAIFEHQKGRPVVEYLHRREAQGWKARFFDLNSKETFILFESSPLTRSGHRYRFLHRSLLEYLYSRVISDSFHPDGQLDEVDHSTAKDACERLADHPLNRRSIVDEPSILQFLAERVESSDLFKTWLRDVIRESKGDAGTGIAAANAITILVRAGVRFNGEDLQGIRIPGADLRGGEFDSANLEGADLRDVNLGKAWLRQANLTNAQMSGTRFGELPYLELEDVVLSCIFSTDGENLVVSTGNDKIRVYETATWTSIAEYQGGGAIAVSPANGELAKRGENNTVELGDILTGEARITLHGHEQTVSCISYSFDGDYIATASEDNTVRIWSTQFGDLVHTLEGHAQPVHGVAFSPDGRQLAFCSQHSTVHTWGTETGQEIFQFNRGVDMFTVAYSPKGRQLAAGGASPRVPVWDPCTGELLHELTGHTGGVLGLKFSLDGLQIASCGQDGTIRLFDALNGTLLNTFSGHLFEVTCIAYSPTRDYIASGSRDRTVRIWKTGEPWSDAFSHRQVEGIACLDVSQNGKQVVIGKADGSIHFWEIWAGKPRIVSTGHTSQVLKVEFSPNGEQVVSASMDGTVRLWCAETGKSLRVFGVNEEAVNDVAFSPCGKWIVSASDDSSVLVWDIDKSDEPESYLIGHEDKVIGASFSPDGEQVASCSKDGTVRIWDASSGELFASTPFEGVERVFYTLEDDQELISVSIADRNLFRWNPRAIGSFDREYESINPDVVCCSLSPCGKLMATGGDRGNLQLWARVSGTLIEIFRSMIGLTYTIGWRQGSECLYLSTVGLDMLRVWKLEEKKDGYHLQLLWRIGLKELSLVDANLEGVVGLDPFDLKLMKQHGAVGTPHE